MTSHATLTVAIATTERRLAQIDPERLPILSEVVWHVFVQTTGATPWRPGLRPDVVLTRTDGTGAANNRNAALKTVDTEYLLFADDDLTFSADGLLALIARFRSERQADFLCARLSDETGAPRKRYSPDGTPVRWWNGAKVGTPELALRTRGFQKLALAFDTRFGAGTENPIGDEYIFLCDAMGLGLRGLHVDVTVASHPRDSSGTRHSPDLMEIRRRVFTRALGRWKSTPARVAFAVRHLRKFTNWREIWRFIR